MKISELKPPTHDEDSASDNLPEDFSAVDSEELRARLKCNHEWYRMLHGKRTVDIEHRQRMKEAKRRVSEQTYVMRAFSYIMAWLFGSFLYILCFPFGIIVQFFDHKPHRVYIDSLLGFLTPRWLHGLDMSIMGLIDLMSYPFRNKRERMGYNIDQSKLWMLRIPMVLLGIFIVGNLFWIVPWVMAVVYKGFFGAIPGVPAPLPVP